MIRSLRKGYTQVDLQYKNTCDTIGAAQFQVEAKSGQAVFRLSLRPAGSNQVEDEEALHTGELLSVTVNDALIRKNLRSFHDSHKGEYSSWRIEVLSKGAVLRFPAKPGVGPSGQLQFTVLHPTDG